MTPTAPDLTRLKVIYRNAEQRYLRSLPPEDFMEATFQATQRKITLESFDLIHAMRPDVHVFNELLVQYPRENEHAPGQVVPDNMVVVYPGEIEAEGSFNLPLQPARPLLVLEYVSKHSVRKDYEINLLKYERDLRVPYYLLFYPDNEELTVFRLAGDKYVTATPNAAGRFTIPELDLEAGLHDGWVRYWFRGELLPLPGDLLRQLNDTKARLTAAERQIDSERQARRAAEAEVERLRAELARAKGQP